MADFKLPDLGEGVTEAEIDRWLVKEGDSIAEDDLLVEVITDKATAEIPSPFAGVVARIHVAEGDVVPVGTVLISIGDESSAAALPPPPPQVARQQVSPGQAMVAGGPPAPPPIATNGRVRAMPPVRKLARDLGVDLMRVDGSGPDGRITRADVEAAAGGTRRQETPGGTRREPLRGIRRLIAERMTAAHAHVPPVTHVEECDVSELDATRRLANDRNPEGPKLTFLPFIVKAVVAGLRSHPQLNAELDEAAGEIVYHDRFDIGVAIDTDKGLVVPTVRAADAKGLHEIANELERLATSARAGRLSTEDTAPSTFTITSPGPFGGLMATPIVFYPQAAILGVHRAGERAVVRDGQIVARLMMNLSITFDHRVLDGMTAARFMLDVVRLLEHPAVLALEE